MRKVGKMGVRDGGRDGENEEGERRENHSEVHRELSGRFCQKLDSTAT